MVLTAGDDLRTERTPVPDRLSIPLAVAVASPPSRPTLDPEPAAENLRLRTYVWSTFSVVAVLMFIYAISVIVRGPSHQFLWLDGFTITGVEGVAALLCILRGLRRSPGSLAPLLLGCSLFAWTLGDLFLTFESIGGASPPTPSIADLSYIAYYPLAYVATVLLMRNVMGRLSRPNWLDGAVAGLGAAAVCAAFAFHDVLRTTGGSVAAAATNLAYPIGDLLLLSLVIGGTVLMSGQRRTPWLLLATGITINVIGDTFNLFSSSSVAATFGSDFNAVAWPISITLMAMSVWIRPRAADPMKIQRVAGFLLPSLAALCGLVILVASTIATVSRVAMGLATATLVVVGLRLSLSARELKVLTEEHHRQALTDELTGLGNRRHLFNALDAYVEDHLNPWTTDRTLAFLFIDLNHFKEINDSFGHPAGDEILRQLQPRLQRAIPSTGSAFRFGGDELAVLLVDADAAEASAVATRIMTELEKPFNLQKMSATVGASIGIALAPADAADATGLLWCADVAMYRAKLGHVPSAFYDQELDGDEYQLNLVDELRDAVDQGSFVLHYQPQLDLETGEILAVEALIRWPHPRLGVVPPMKFLPLAEDAGLMRELTAWVLDEALGQCARWREAGRELSVSVNVTTTNLLQPGFTDEVQTLLAQYGLPGEALVIEITETSIITDFVGSKAAIERLRAMGVIVSIDDFGAGFTSLAYLSGLAVGELKLDRTFITGLSEIGKERELELVRATIQLGHDMGLRVVAEGIEDVVTLDLLGELGCDLAQGYYISRPMPADQLAFRSGTAKPLELPVSS